MYKKKLDCKDFIIKYIQSSKKLEVIKNEPLQIEIDNVMKKKNKDNNCNVGYEIKFKITENEKVTFETATIRLRYKNGTGLYGVCWQLGIVKY